MTRNSAGGPAETGDRLELVRHLATEIVSGRIAPVEGARRIAAQASDDLEHLTVFGDLVGEWESGEREDAERGILEQASLLLADTA